jgi:branched-chain amino acid transport system substrate-binding protein
MWLLLFALMLALLAGCNPTDEDDSGQDQGGLGPGPDKTAGSSGNAAAGGPVKLGFVFEETGDAATFGQSSRKGAEMALEEINAAGGLLGKPVEFVFEDNNSKADQAATAASKLVNNDKVNAIIGCVASSNSIAMKKITDPMKIPLISPASTRVDFTLADDKQTPLQYVFRTCFTDDFQGEAMVDFAVNGPLHAKNAVIFYASDNDYALGIYDTVKTTAAAKGLTIVGEDSFLSSSETDFRTKLSKFKGLAFDVLIVPGYYKEAALIANQARELGIKQPLLGGDGFDSADLWKNAGANIEGSYFTNHYAADDKDPAVQEFITKYKAREGGNVPDAMAILAYDCVKCVADAIARAGTTDGTAIAAELAKTKDFHGAAGDITIDAKHNATKKLVVMGIGKGGALNWAYSYMPGNASSGAAVDSAATPAAENGSAGDGQSGAATPPAAGGSGGRPLPPSTPPMGGR